MTLSKSPVFGNYIHSEPKFIGNYIHSEPKFIGAFPDRKDYPFNTGTYGTTLMDEKPVKKEAPETFKIGDRVRVKEITDPARPECYRRLSNEFGVVSYVGDLAAMVWFPQIAETFTLMFDTLKKEFDIGDKVYYRRYSNGVGTITEGQNIYGDYTAEFSGGIVKTYYGDLEYIPETKKSGDDLTIKAGGTFTLNSGTFGPGPDTFKMNQPIFMDKQAENRLDRGTHSYSVKFLTAEDIYMSIKISTDPKSTLVKNWDEMNEVFEKCYGSQTTYSATIVLASGRVVNIPNPNKKDWTLKSTEKVTRIEPILLDHAEGNEDVDEFVLNSFVEHEEGLCWLKDMSRIIEQKDVVSPFETKFSYVTEIRKYVRKPLETPAYECTMPALRCLW